MKGKRDRGMFEEITTEEKAIELQNQLGKRILQDSKFEEDNVRIVAGVDLAYWGKQDNEYAICCVVVIDYKTKEILETTHVLGKIAFPYIPGCLAFRELPLILKAIKKLENEPDIYIFDGNGYLHPRHMGIATHAAMYLDKPTIGVAKSYHKIEGVAFVMPKNYTNSYTDIVIRGDVYGRVLRTHKDVKPIFVSIGNFIDLETATIIIGKLITKESHVPLPIRLADLETHKWRKIYKQDNLKILTNLVY